MENGNSTFVELSETDYCSIYIHSGKSFNSKFFFLLSRAEKKGGGGKGKEASKHDRFWGGGKGVSRGTQRRGGWKGEDEVESGHDACVAASMVLV